ncbi:TPA: hypothetical protein SIA39_004119 [Aeromonas sobria]|nr:hypothetical protein [Aeromonas sobria]
MEAITITAIWQWVTAVVIPAAGTLLWSYRNEIKALNEFKVRSEVETDNMRAEITDLKQNQQDFRAEIRDEIRLLGQDIKADMMAIRADIKESKK